MRERSFDSPRVRMRTRGVTGSQDKYAWSRKRKVCLGGLAWRHLQLMDQIKNQPERPSERRSRALKTGACAVCVPGSVRRLAAVSCCPLPRRRLLHVARIRAPGAGGLSLPGQEGLTGAGVGESVFSRLLLQGHTLRTETQEVKHGVPVAKPQTRTDHRENTWVQYALT